MNIVKAFHLKSWADTVSARADLPELVRMLIRASCPRLEHYRFLGGDASQAHGWDGVVETFEGNTFVPEGRSIWEFGTDKKYKTKADKEFARVTSQLNEEERSTRSFVFVTPRIWDTGPEEWEREHSSYGWKRVRILDAISLEHWLSDHPPVSIPYAKKLEILPPDGIQSVREFWDEYRLSIKPPLKEELLLAGREERAKRLCDSLSVGLPGLSKWQADSATEAAAFIAAAVIGAGGELSTFLLSKTIFVYSQEAARALPSPGRFNLILHPAAARLGPALAKTNGVTLVLGNNDIASDAESLDRMNTRDFAAGLIAMGLDELEAFRLAGICGRSVTVLSRLNASGSVAAPEWRNRIELIPLMLAGGWDASNEHDCAVVATLCGRAYEHVEANARELSSLPDAPLDLHGSVWTIRSPKDAFTLLGHLVGSTSQIRLRDACIRVFSEIDRTLDVPGDDRPIIPTRGADFLHSEWLRRGLSTTLLLISGLHDAAKFRTIGGTPEHFVDGVVAALPGLNTDIQLLASLKNEFPKLAEAAPVPLAYALEQVLEGDSRRWQPIIFRDKKSQFPWGSFSPHTYILWALETLAWDPGYLYKAASLLLTLAHFDPGGETSNRPLQSLRGIFLAWRPNTNASVEERVAVLRSICRARPRAGLDLAMSLLPVSHDHSMGNAKPRLRDFGDARSNAITVGEMHFAFHKYAEIAIELAGTDIRRLIALVERIPQFDLSHREIVASAIRLGAQTAVDADVFELWSRLRDLIQKHRQFQNTDWAIREDELTPLEALCRELAPHDPVRLITWLFDDFLPQIGPSKSQDYVGEAHRERHKALQQLFHEHGLEAVTDLARSVKLPHLVGFTLAESAPTQYVLEQVMSFAVSANSGIDEAFAIALSASAHERFGASWDGWIHDRAQEMDARRAANLFLRWNDCRSTWMFVSTLGEEVEREYWRRKPAFKQAQDEDLRFALDKYINVGRFSACLDMVSYDENRLPTAMCIKVLGGLSQETNDEVWKLQRTQYSVIHMIEALQQREDADLVELAGIEYQYLPLLQHQAEPIALHKLLVKSPAFFVSVVCDVFFPASGESREITDDRRHRASLGYRILQSIKTVPGYSSDVEDVNFLKWWIEEVRRLASESDRVVITDQHIGQILAYAPSDSIDGAWPSRSIRNLIEELAADEIEKGIANSRYNMRGVHWKGLHDGGGQERALAAEYRQWAAAANLWPRTGSLLRQVAMDWDLSADAADTRAQLDQLRDA